MTNSIALVLGILLIGALAIDGMIYGSEHVIFLSKRFMELLNWVAFWR